MKSTVELVRKYRDMHGGSDRKAAPHVGVSQAAFSLWCSGTQLPTEERVIQMAKAIGEDADLAVVILRMERAKSEEARSAWRRVAEKFRDAAVVAALAVGAASFGVTPTPAQAANNGGGVNPTLHNSDYTLHSRRRRKRGAFGRAVAAALGIGLSACTTVDTHTEPPADWPQLEIVIEHHPHHVMRDICGPYAPALASPEACALIDFQARRCRIVLSADFNTPELERHEALHCAGHDHVGSDSLAHAWALEKARIAARAISAAAATSSPN